jgi:hypothetical protein
MTDHHGTWPTTGSGTTGRPTGPAPGDDAELPDRAWGWWDMFVPPEEDPRSDGGFRGERETLVGYLRDQRLTLQLKCAGLDAEAMAKRSVPPSTMSLLGLVRHLADVELNWFRRVMAGQDVSRRYRTDEDPDGAFTGAVADSEAVAEAWGTWQAEVAFAEAFVEQAPAWAPPARTTVSPWSCGRCSST